MCVFLFNCSAVKLLRKSEQQFQMQQRGESLASVLAQPCYCSIPILVSLSLPVHKLSYLSVSDVDAARPVPIV